MDPRFRRALVGAMALCFVAACGGDGGSRDPTCADAKLQAASEFFACLVQAGTEVGDAASDAEVAACDARFDTAFEEAEAKLVSGTTCEVLGTKMGTREAIRGAVTNLVVADTEKTLTIDIASPQIEDLVGTGAALHIARKVNGVFNYVGLVSGRYMQSNIFQYGSSLRIFAGTFVLEDGVTATASAQTSIGLGHTVEFTSDLTFGAVSAGGPSTAITLTNNASVSPLAFGISQPQVFNDEETTGVVSVIPAIPRGVVMISPQDELAVWFASGEEGVLAEGAPSDAVFVDMSTSSTRTVRYDGQWSVED